MVSFSCEACNDVIKKPKLDQHRGRCTNARFSCIDCSTTFNGTDYRAHTSCMSEEQKYQGALYKEKKPKSGKKARPTENGHTGGSDGEDPKSGSEKEAKTEKEKSKTARRREKRERLRAKRLEKMEMKERHRAESRARKAAQEGVDVSTLDDPPATKSKKRKGSPTGGDKPLKSRKTAAPESAQAAEELLERVKDGRPLSLLKALHRVGKNSEVDRDEVLAMLKLKKEKEGVMISVFKSEQLE